MPYFFFFLEENLDYKGPLASSALSCVNVHKDFMLLQNTTMEQLSIDFQIQEDVGRENSALIINMPPL